MIKNINISAIFICFIILISHLCYAKSSQKKTKYVTANQSTNQLDLDPDTLEHNQTQTALMLFAKIEPTNSIYEEKIEEIYGENGLNIPNENIIQIKKTYCYLEFLAKIDKIKNNPEYNQYKNSFENFLEKKNGDELLFPTNDLIKSKDWKSIPIAAQDLIDSATWQICLQAIVCDSIDNITSTMVDVIEVQNQISTFLQNIETAYPTQDYTELRLYLESIELQILLQSERKNDYIDQSKKFKNLTTNQLDQAITQFKKTDFYIQTHNQQNDQPVEKNFSNNKKSTSIATSVQKQILFYFMFVHIQSTLYKMLNTTNLQNFLSQTNIDETMPKIFSYNSKEFIYLNDFLMLKEFNEYNKKNPIQTTIIMTPAYEQNITESIASTTNSSEAKQNNKNLNNIKEENTIPFENTTEINENDEIIAQKANTQLAEKIFTKDFPTNSIYEKTIDTIYGPSGLNLDQEIIKKIKNTYCYLEFLVKLDKVSHDNKLSDYLVDFQSFINSEKLAIPTQDLMNTKGWKSIIINKEDLLESSAWQGFVKLAICDSFDRTMQFMIDITEVNLQMTGYLANIEAGYNDDEFSQMRLYSESIQLYELLQSNHKSRYLAQCKDWKNLNSKQLLKAITAFKNEDLYQSIYNNQNNQISIQTKKKLISKTPQDVCSFFMLKNIQNDIYNNIQLTNLELMLNQANSNPLFLNFFMYEQSDFIYLFDYLTLGNLIEENKIRLENYLQKNELENDDESENLQNQVIIQKTKNPFSKTNKASRRFFSKNGKIITKESKKAIEVLDKNGKIIGNALKEGIKNINTEIGKIANNLATGFITMSGALAYGFVMIGGSKISAEKARQRTIKKMNAHKNIIGIALTLVIVYGIGILLIPLLPLIILPATIYAVSAIAVDKRVRDPLMKGMMVVMTPIMIAMEKMTDAFTYGFIEMSAGLTFAGCETGLGFTNSIGLFVKAIDRQAWERMKSPISNPKQRAHAVRTKLKKYKNALNIIMSVVITILISIVIIVISAGIGAAYTAAANAGLLGAEAAATSATAAASAATTSATTASATAVTAKAAETSAIAAATSARITAQQAATAAANTALTGSAKQSAQIAAQQAAQAATAAAARQATATAARQAAEVAAKQAAEVAAQATAKAAARQAALSATKQLAVKKTEEIAAKQALQLAMKQGGDVAAKQALVQQSTISRVAAEQAVKQTSENIVKQSAELTLKQGSYKITQATTQKALTNKGLQQAASTTVKQSGTQTTLGGTSQTSSSALTKETLETTLKNSQTIANNAAKNFTNKQIAKEIAKNSLDEAAQTLKTAQAGLAKDPNNVFAQAAVKAAQKNIATAATKDTLAAEQLVQAATTNSIKQAELSGIKAVANNNAFKDAYVASSKFTTQKAAHEAGQITDKEIIKAAQQIQTTRQAQLANMSAYKSAKLSQMSGDTIGQSIATGIRQELVTWSFVIGQALNAGFGVFSVLGAVNQDEITAMQAEQEKKSIKTLWKFVENNKIAITQEQNHFSNELHKKHRAALENQAFSLQYYKNFLNGSVNLMQQQIAQVLAEQQQELLTQDENGLTQADIGSSWGLQTKFVYLYPSQGFISTTLGRPDFPYAQEIAQAPLVFEQNQKQANSNLINQKTQDTKLWFNQRAVAIAQKETNKPLQVEIKFRIIYNLNTAYHVGLYLGGNYHDYSSPEYLKSLQDTGIIDTNETYLAKMFVIKRDDAIKNPSLGVYENEGGDWIMDQPLDPKTINTASIYHMSANLDKDQLTVTFWQEDNPLNKITKTMTVKPCDQRTFGIIFSGVAVEWGVIEPNVPITENIKARPALDRPSEIEREKAAKNQRSFNDLATNNQNIHESNINLINPDQQTENISALQTQAAGQATIQITSEKNLELQNSISIDN